MRSARASSGCAWRRSSSSTPTTRSHLFYALLLKDAGCSANSARMAALFGADDHAAKRTSKRVDWSGRFPAFVWAVRTVAPGGIAAPRGSDRLLAIKAEGEVTRALMQARCDRGAEIAHLLGFEAETAEAIRTLDEHWDGRASRAACAARRSRCSGGSCASHRPPRSSTPRRRRGRLGGSRGGARGGWFDPALVEALSRDLRRHGVLGVAARGRRPPPLGAARPRSCRRRGAPRPRSPTPSPA